MKTEQEIRDAMKALRDEVFGLERAAIESLRLTESLSTDAGDLLREWAAIKEEMAATCNVADTDEGKAAWSELCRRASNVEHRMSAWVADRDALATHCPDCGTVGCATCKSEAA